MAASKIALLSSDELPSFFAHGARVELEAPESASNASSARFTTEVAEQYASKQPAVVVCAE
jgi:hypothetical protein